MLEAQLPLRALAQNHSKFVGRTADARLVSPNARPFGLTYAEWSVRWWQWALAIPAARNPILDPDGRFAAEGQHGPVWFLAGTFGGTTSRTVNVPLGKFVFLPIINFIADYPCPGGDFCGTTPLQQCLSEQAAFYMDRVTELECVVDGVPIPMRKLFRQRAASDLFTFLGDPSMAAVDACITGTPQPGVSDGYWVMLTPMTPGLHTVYFRGKVVVEGPGGFTFETSLLYKLNVGGC